MIKNREVAGHMVVDLPGGVFAMGSAGLHSVLGDCSPRLVRLDPFSAGVTHVTVEQFLDVVRRPDLEGLPGRVPVTSVSVAECRTYLERRNGNALSSCRLRFLTEAELECLARGPAVDVRKFMDERGLRGSRDFSEYLGCAGYSSHGLFPCLENFVPRLELGATLVAGPRSPGFSRLIDGAGPVFAWRSWATATGRPPTAEESWYFRSGPATASPHKRVNGYGLSDVTGNVLSWGADQYFRSHDLLPRVNPRRDDGDTFYEYVQRGGSWKFDDVLALHSAMRYSGHFINRYPSVGLRVGA